MPSEMIIAVAIGAASSFVASYFPRRALDAYRARQRRLAPRSDAQLAEFLQCLERELERRRTAALVNPDAPTHDERSRGGIVD